MGTVVEVPLNVSVEDLADVQVSQGCVLHDTLARIAAQVVRDLRALVLHSGWHRGDHIGLGTARRWRLGSTVSNVRRIAPRVTKLRALVAHMGTGKGPLWRHVLLNVLHRVNGTLDDAVLASLPL